MFYQILKTNKPSFDQIRQLRALVDESAEKDGYPIKVYWDVLYKRGGTYLSDYFYYQNQKLIASLSLYRFKADVIELTGVTHPSLRREGYYRYLLTEAMNELKRVNIQKLTFICHQHSKSFIDYLVKKQVRFDHSEERLLATENFELQENADISIRRAQKEDVDIMAAIHQESFSGNVENHKRYIMNCFNEESYEMWLCIYHGQAIGKLHFYFNEFNEILIHDLGVRKEFRRQGLGMIMLKQLLKHLFSDLKVKIYADIYTSDAGVVEFYKKCGFVKADRYNFYQSTVARFT